MSNSPTEPCKCKGTIMDPEQRSLGNHPGIIEYIGNWYVFSFNYVISYSMTNVHRKRRSICVEKMSYNSIGTIKILPWWIAAGVPQIGNLNPYIRNKAETIDWKSCVKIERSKRKGIYVTNINNGNYIKVK